MKTKLMIVLCSAAIFISGCATAHRPSAWEYKTVSAYLGQTGNLNPGRPKPLSLAEKINEAAAEGWEVVSTGSEGEGGYPFALLRKLK